MTNPASLTPVSAFVNLIKDLDPSDLSLADLLQTPDAESAIRARINATPVFDRVHLVNERSELDGFSPLYIAAEKGQVECVRALLDASADVNAKNGQFQETALHIAAQCGFDEIVLLLLKFQADTESTNLMGMRPLYIAAKWGKTECVKLLLGAKAAINAKNSNDDETALHGAASIGNMEILDLLLKAGADQEAIDLKGCGPLYLAADSGKIECMRLLLVSRADPNSLNGSLRLTPLHALANKGHHLAIDLLINKGADKEARDRHGLTPLYTAAKSGKAACVKALLAADAKIYAKNGPNGETALDTAVAYGHTEVIAALLEKGADWQSLDFSKALSPLITIGREDVANLFIQQMIAEVERLDAVFTKKHNLLSYQKLIFQFCEYVDKISSLPSHKNFLELFFSKTQKTTRTLVFSYHLQTLIERKIQFLEKNQDPEQLEQFQHVLKELTLALTKLLSAVFKPELLPMANTQFSLTRYIDRVSELQGKTSSHKRKGDSPTQPVKEARPADKWHIVSFPGTEPVNVTSDDE